MTAKKLLVGGGVAWALLERSAPGDAADVETHLLLQASIGRYVGSYQLIERPPQLFHQRETQTVCGQLIRGAAAEVTDPRRGVTYHPQNSRSTKGQIRTPPLIAIARGADDVHPFFFSYIIAIIQRRTVEGSRMSERDASAPSCTIRYGIMTEA